MGTERSEIRSVPLERKADALYFVLNSQGICLPTSPSFENNTPGRWLVRAENGVVNRLRNPLGNFFKPQDGQYGDFGVFLGDNLSSLMYPDRGIYWVFESREISERWLSAPSGEWQEMYGQVLYENGLNPARVTDGYRAENEMYKRFYVYKRRSGVCTSPEPLSPLKASKVLVTEGILSRQEIDRLPSEIGEKLVVLKYE